MKKIMIALMALTMLCTPVFATEFKDVHDFDDTLTELNNEDIKEEMSILDGLFAELEGLVKSNPTVSKTVNLQNIDSEAFAGLKLSDQLKMFKQNYESMLSVSVEMLEALEQNESYMLKYYTLVNQIYVHYDKLLGILEKIIKSQNEDIQTVMNEMKSAVENAQNVKSQLDLCNELAKKQSEEIAALTRIKKRTRSLSYIELGIGIPCLVIGCLPIWTDEQQNIKNLFLGVGATGTAAGVATFSFTITF